MVSAGAPAFSSLAVPLCVRMPAWSLGGIPDRCMHGALALLQLPVIAVTSAETCVLKGTHLLCLFLLSFFLVYSFLSPGSQLLPGRLGLFLAALHICLLENLVTAYLGSWTKLSVQREPWLVMK